MVICLERGADLHIAQLMPLPLTVSCFSKIQIGLPFLVPAHLGSPGKRAIKRVCVCCSIASFTFLLNQQPAWSYPTLGQVIKINWSKFLKTKPLPVAKRHCQINTRHGTISCHIECIAQMRPVATVCGQLGGEQMEKIKEPYIRSAVVHRSHRKEYFSGKCAGPLPSIKYSKAWCE